MAGGLPAEQRVQQFAHVCAAAATLDDLHRTALPALAAAVAAFAVALVRPVDGDCRVVAAVGSQLDWADLGDDCGRATRLTGDALPPAWRSAGVTAARTQPLTGADGSLLVAWEGTADRDDGEWISAAAPLLGASTGRLQSGAALADLRERVTSAQALADMGDYDWDIAIDSNVWSDQLYRIYGHQPQSFNPSYERFLSMIHPEDQERIRAIHRRAYATGEPFEMVERIVRPDGEVRYLASNGEVVMGPDGTPARMRGTCIDITEQYLAEQRVEQTLGLFRTLVESFPDALLVVGADGTVTRASARATRVFGGDVTGRPLREIVDPGEPPAPALLAHPARALDGTVLQVDVTTVPLEEEADDASLAVFVHDAAPRLEAEEVAARYREAGVRRRQALEINDNVVQGLTAATYALQSGRGEAAAEYLQRTLANARQMMDDLLGSLDGQDLQPGDLVRERPADSGGHRRVLEDEPPPGETPAATRVLLVDDADDVRLLLRSLLRSAAGYTVVGEAADGREAIELCRTHQPDLVLLDLAMPVMDGLQALPHIRAVAPDARVVVLSGFDRAHMAQRTLDAGAAHYVEKGRALTDLIAVLADVTAAS